MAMMATPRTSISSDLNIEEIVDTGNFKEISDNKKRKRIESSSPQVELGNKIFKIQGVNKNISTINGVSLKKDLLNVDRSINQNQIRMHTDYITIKSLNSSQETKIKNIASLGGVDVRVSEGEKPIPRENLNKVIIFGVSLDLTEDEITSETSALSTYRMTKFDHSLNSKTPTNNVVLTFNHEPPDFVYIGFTRFKTRTYIPHPLRCTKCQRFGHSHLACRGKLTCPRCSGNHSVGDCTIPKFSNDGEQADIAQYRCLNCKGNHSTAFRGCPAFKEAQEITKIKIQNKISYSEAVKTLRNTGIKENIQLTSSQNANFMDLGETRNTVEQPPFPSLLNREEVISVNSHPSYISQIPVMTEPSGSTTPGIVQRDQHGVLDHKILEDLLVNLLLVFSNIFDLDTLFKLVLRKKASFSGLGIDSTASTSI